MRRPLLRAVSTVVLLAASAGVWANDDTAVRRASQRAEAAEEALSARYAAIWRTLDAAQKSAFSARERAWLNGGRQAEQHACVAQAGADTALTARSCAAAVVERHAEALAASERLPVAAH